MNKNIIVRILCAILCIGAMMLAAGCKGQTTYLSPESSQEPAQTVSTVQESSETSAEESSQPEQSTQESSTPEQSSEMQSSAEPVTPESSQEAPESSQAAPESSVTETSMSALPQVVPASAADVPEDDKAEIKNKKLDSAVSGGKKDATPTSSPKFTTRMDQKRTGDEERVIGAVYTDFDNYCFAMAEQQRSSGTVYIRTVFDDVDATYVQCFLEKGGRTYLLDETAKNYYSVTESDVNSGPYKTVMGLTDTFSELTESGTCTIGGETASYEMYKGTGETLITYWNGDTFIKGEIYSGDTLAGLVYFDFARNVSAALTSIPSDYSEG